MKKFSSFLKELRNSAELNQSQFADIMEVSPLLITLLETDKKEPSKKFVNSLADKLGVKSNSILPLISDEDIDPNALSGIEKKLIQTVDALQIMLIRKKAKNLRSYAQNA
ncbi:MAG: helix-turn-helix transcriptional regulator [Candidatus Gracilibacteria bacterium]|nr:helix-turn-helix transcriptional regulator [Candidatus Gracilibacteria bacterium]